MKVVVLAGGLSTERDVSLSTGKMIYQALKKNGHQAILVDVYLGYNMDNNDITDITDITDIVDVRGVFEQDIDWGAQIGEVGVTNPDLEQVKAMRKGNSLRFFGENVIPLCEEADVVFLALHGASGEDGRIQACFDLLGIPYTGTDFVSSAMAMDKGITKDLFQAHNIPTPAGIRLLEGEKESERISYPCIVKASCGGSSVGVYIANQDEEYEQAKKEAFRYDKELIIEQYIEGREFSVGVMGGVAMPVIEIAPKQGFYDYTNKYQAGSSVETCPADLSPEKTKEVQELAEKVFAILRMKSYARMDFRMNHDGEFFCLEANSLPGMTPTSLLPQEAAQMGLSFEQLCEEIIQYAFRGKETI